MLRYSVDTLTVRTNKRILNRDFPATGCCIRAQKYFTKFTVILKTMITMENRIELKKVE